MDATLRVRRLAVGQGAFFVASGLWPIVHLRSFEAVTGPKPERWLVKTVGALIAVAGAALIVAGARRTVGPEAAVLGAGSAGALALVDLWYAGLRRRIAPVYLADAAVELALVAGWAASAGGVRGPIDPEEARAAVG
jgi:hypothetical protein